MAIEKFETGDVLTKQRINQIVEGVNNTMKGMIETTYSALKTLRDDGELTPGQQYRITDYECTSAQNDTSCAGHQFDIIVTADSSNALNENARAALHSGDTYFADCDLVSWELKYSLDNNTDRFVWADSTNGKGVIYYMKDEWNNECCYDFKNIQYKRYEISDASILAFKTSDTDNNPNGFYYGTYTLDGNEAISNAVYGNNYIWCYTFMYKDLNDDTWFDGSLVGNKFPEEGDVCCKDNSIEAGNADYENDYWYSQMYLNDIVFYGAAGIDDGGSPCYDNKIKAGSFIITFGKCCYGNNIGMYNHYNTFGNNVNYNTFGNDVYYNTFGNSVNDNTFGNYVYSNTFGNEVYSNTFGNYVFDNTFGNYVFDNTFGNYVYSNTFGNYIQYNTFGNSVNYNTFGNYVFDNTFGNEVCDNTFGNNVYRNTFGNVVYWNTFGNYFYYNIVENDILYLNFTTNYTTANNSYLQHIHILNGFKYNSLTAVPTGITLNAAYCQFIGKNSSGTFTVKKPLD